MHSMFIFEFSTMALPMKTLTTLMCSCRALMDIRIIIMFLVGLIIQSGPNFDQARHMNRKTGRANTETPPGPFNLPKHVE